MKRFSSYAFIAILLSSALSCAGAKAVDKILKAHFFAAGGLERLNEIQTVRRSGDWVFNGDQVSDWATFEEAIIIGEKSYSQKISLFQNTHDFTETIVWNKTEGLAHEFLCGRSERNFCV